MAVLHCNNISNDMRTYSTIQIQLPQKTFCSGSGTYSIISFSNHLPMVLVYLFVVLSVVDSAVAVHKKQAIHSNKE